nr:hypothetical protein GCM10020185_77450 [Pseudomonas brassicacearum subsp. brassicacearum]
MALVLGLRPGSDPVAAVQTVSVATADSPSLARLGNQHVSPDELKALLAALAPEVRQQMRGNRAALEGWIRARLAEKGRVGAGRRPGLARAARGGAPDPGGG